MYHVHISVCVRMVDTLQIASCMVHTILSWKIFKTLRQHSHQPRQGSNQALLKYNS